MQTNDVVLQIAAQAGITEKQAREALNAVKQCVVKALKVNDSITLVGFGTFSLKARVGRYVCNPKTGRRWRIEETNLPVFTPGRGLREALKP